MITPVLQTNRLLLQLLTIDNAAEVGVLYNHPQVSLHFELEPLESDEQLINFTNRIINSSIAIWSIRLLTNPERIIGDCAIHHLNEEKRSIQTGGTLLPEYWGQGYMAEAIAKLEEFSISQFNIRKIIWKTSSRNIKAIHFALNQGFAFVGRVDDEVEFEKIIS